jgi:hypothetical protein
LCVLSYVLLRLSRSVCWFCVVRLLLRKYRTLRENLNLRHSDYLFVSVVRD